MTPSQPHPVLSFRDVHRVYGEGSGAVRALDGVTVDVEPSRFTAVMGPSGSGKSTFMNLAAGLDDPTSGEVWLAGQPLHAMDEDRRTRLRRDHVGFVFQAFNLVPTLTARENVVLPFELAGRRLTADDRARIDGLLESLGLLARAGHRPAALSGGQQQRVAIARALAIGPHVVIADEPTGNLDTRSSREVLSLMRTAADEYRQTILMVTHDPVAASYADRIIVIADGRIVGDHPGLAPAAIADLMVSLEVGAA
ncbi:ABC transporter, ATP-binding protein [Nostocoides japonicum T1-X7]|uniref:ABC transporter, ATP-binding protein n=1 Tax=Nostocoides japonicum T1-X7 TaxID=1194083 RepID=A0A077M883_9MICO|nr:ABC transporter ATP-binding protein [Tetrasphaera japonica]CCH80274.1 ABC transporter, ATP-binding protein [Tetrasphaera japonica T1-X7]